MIIAPHHRIYTCFFLFAVSLVRCSPACRICR